MEGLPLTAEQANAAFDVLVMHLGVNPRQRSQFVCTHTSSFIAHTPLVSIIPGATFCRRLAGRLEQWSVEVPEDGTNEPRRQAAATSVNAALDALMLRLV